MGAVVVVNLRKVGLVNKKKKSLFDVKTHLKLFKEEQERPAIIFLSF